MNTRRAVINALKKASFSDVEKAYANDPAGVLRALQMHVYRLNTDIIRWRAIVYLGTLAGHHAAQEDDVYRNIIRRFIWQMCEESANVPWASPEVISSIMRSAKYHQYVEFVGPLFYHAGLNDICYAGLFWAIGILAPTHGAVMEEFMGEVYERLDMDDIEIRAYGAWAFSQYPHEQARPYLEKLLNDHREATVFTGENYMVQPISSFAKNALDVLLSGAS